MAKKKPALGAPVVVQAWAVLMPSGKLGPDGFTELPFISRRKMEAVTHSEDLFRDGKEGGVAIRVTVTISQQ